MALASAGDTDVYDWLPGVAFCSNLMRFFAFRFFISAFLVAVPFLKDPDNICFHFIAISLVNTTPGTSTMKLSTAVFNT
jgi:hypothetical protein